MNPTQLGMLYDLNPPSPYAGERSASPAARHYLQPLGATGSIIARAQQLARIDAALKQGLGENLRDHCQLGNIRGNVVVLYTDSAAPATELRFRQLEVLACLQSACGVRCDSIEIRINPSIFERR